MKIRASEALKHPRWVCGLLLATCVFIGPVGRLSAWAQRVNDQPLIRVLIYDYAYVDRLELKEGENEAAELFAQAGVRVVWTGYWQEQRRDRGQAENSDADFFIRIFPASMARRWNYKAGALGDSVIPPGVEGPLRGGCANVFYDRVQHLSILWDMFPGEALGDAMAHELGHLLLGADHSGEGIMKARWDVQDLELAKGGKLRFLPAETTAIQRAARSLPRNSPAMVSTLH